MGARAERRLDWSRIGTWSHVGPRGTRMAVQAKRASVSEAVARSSVVHYGESLLITFSCFTKYFKIVDGVHVHA